MIESIKDFVFKTKSYTILAETLQIDHPSWTNSVYISSNIPTFTALDESGNSVKYENMPVIIKKGDISDSLEQSITITVGDLGEVFPNLIDKVNSYRTKVKPSITYRSYVFDSKTADLSNNKPIQVIKGLNVDSSATDHQATSFKASTKNHNSTKTGMFYDIDEFPDLEGFL